MKLKKLDPKGFSHYVLPLAFVVIFSIAGVGYLVAGHADSPLYVVENCIFNRHCAHTPVPPMPAPTKPVKYPLVRPPGDPCLLSSNNCPSSTKPKPVTKPDTTKTAASQPVAYTSSTTRVAAPAIVRSKPLCKTQKFVLGSKGTCVEKIQIILNDVDAHLSKDIDITGNFGSATRGKVVAFQKRYPAIGSLSGSVGPHTWFKLCEKGNNAYNSPSAFAPDTFDSATLRKALEWVGCR